MVVLLCIILAIDAVILPSLVSQVTEIVLEQVYVVIFAVLIWAACVGYRVPETTVKGFEHTDIAVSHMGLLTALARMDQDTIFVFVGVAVFRGLNVFLGNTEVVAGRVATDIRVNREAWQAWTRHRGEFEVFPYTAHTQMKAFQ
ncbi:MAG: hypothetical protein JAZ19_13760 [Candidatus Thiodiazotropha taylori]|nr:hypothetical protein [Candidatus Thiodiazotropha taylori]